MLGLLVDPSIIDNVTTSAGAVLAAVIVATAGFFGYGRQKKADRDYDLIKRRQQEYERFITAYSTAGRWKTEVNNLAEYTAYWDDQVKQMQGVRDQDDEELTMAVHRYNYYAQKHEDAEENRRRAEGEYYEAHDNLLPIGSDETILAVNNFHRHVADRERNDPLEHKILYAKMLIAMRRDSFEETKLSVKEVAMNIPWTYGDEDENPIDWDRVGDNGERL